MKITINLKIFMLLTLFFCIVLINFGSDIGLGAMPFYYFFIGLLAVFTLVKLYNKPSSYLNTFIRTQSFRYFILYILWILVCKIFFIFTGSDTRGIFYIFFILLLPFILFTINIPKILSYKKIIKMLMIFYLIIFIMGIIEFVTNFYHIDFLSNIFKIFINFKSVSSDYEYAGYSAFSLPRVASLFLEPSNLGFFIITSIPIIYKLCTSNNSIFANLLTDKSIKFALILLSIINLLLTQSPMFIGVGVIIGAIYFIRKNKFNYQKSFIKLFIICLILGLIIFNIDVNNSFINRIFIVFNNINDFSSLILQESSLGTRIVTDINQFCIFLNHMITGVGVGNIYHFFPEQLSKSPIPITYELYTNIKHVKIYEGGGSSFVFAGLAETGLIGFSLFMAFLINLLYSINKAVNFYSGITKDFAIGLKYFLIIFLALLIYDSKQNVIIIIFYLSLIQSLVVYKIENKNKELERK